MGFPCGLAGKESACNARDLGSIPGLGKSPGEGKGYSLQYSGLENSMDCKVHGVAKSRTQLSYLHLCTTYYWILEASVVLCSSQLKVGHQEDFWGKHVGFWFSSFYYYTDKICSWLYAFIGQDSECQVYLTQIHSHFFNSTQRAGHSYWTLM